MKQFDIFADEFPLFEPEDAMPNVADLVEAFKNDKTPIVPLKPSAPAGFIAFRETLEKLGVHRSRQKSLAADLSDEAVVCFKSPCYWIKKEDHEKIIKKYRSYPPYYFYASRVNDRQRGLDYLEDTMQLAGFTKARSTLNRRPIVRTLEQEEIYVLRENRHYKHATADRERIIQLLRGIEL